MRRTKAGALPPGARGTAPARGLHACAAVLAGALLLGGLAAGIAGCGSDSSPPKRDYLYIANPASSNVLGRKVNGDNGKLSSTKNQPTSTAVAMDWLAADPSGANLYGIGRDDDVIDAFGIKANSGALTFVDGWFVSPGQRPSSVVVVPGGGFVYVSNETTDNVTGFTRDSASGRLTSLGVHAVGGSPAWIRSDSGGSHLYVANAGSNDVTVLTVGSGGTLTTAQASVAAGTSPSALALRPDDAFLYVTNQGSSSVSVYAIAGDGTLTLVQTAATDSEPRALAVTPDGAYLYVANERSALSYGTVSAFSIDAGSGTLTALSGSPYPAGAALRDAVIDPSGTYLYVTNSASGTVSGYEIDPDTGSLHPTPDSPTNAGSGPKGIAAVKHP